MVKSVLDYQIVTDKYSGTIHEYTETGRSGYLKMTSTVSFLT